MSTFTDSTVAADADAPRLGRSVSLDQAARLLGVCRRTIYNRIRDGRLQTIRTAGGSQRVLIDSCPELADTKTAGRAGAPAARQLEP